MANHVLLDNITHKDLKIRTGYGKNQGFDVSLTRVFPVEFSQLQCEYPIFFSKNTDTNQFEPIVLLGFEEHENLYLGEQDWNARYIPLSIQRQPFLIGFQSKVEGGVPTREPVVHIDLNHSSVNHSEGEPVFLEHGGATPYLEHITSVLMTIQQGHEINTAFCQTLVGLDLIESVTMEVALNDRSKHTLVGFYTINEDKLAKLSGSALEALHQKGYLRLIYMMLASLPNIRILIDRKSDQQPLAKAS